MGIVRMVFRTEIQEPYMCVKRFGRLVVNLQDQLHVPEPIPNAGIDDLT